jgi:hypothetical protein
MLYKIQQPIKNKKRNEIQREDRNDITKTKSNFNKNPQIIQIGGSFCNIRAIVSVSCQAGVNDQSHNGWREFSAIGRKSQSTSVL